MEEKLNALIEVSRKFGKNPDYIIAGGGNTSFKDDDKIWVKASGTSMADIDKGGFVCLDRNKLKILSGKKYSQDSSEREAQVKEDLAKAIISPKDKRPSVETSMHEIIQFPFIVHTHPTKVNGLLCGKDSKELVGKLFGDDVLYIEYTDPGYVLFKAVDNALQDFRQRKGKEPVIIFLENHGVFVGGETTGDIEDVYADIDEKLTKYISDFPGNLKNRDLKELKDTGNKIISFPEMKDMKFITLANELTDKFVKNKAAFEKILVPFTPDNIVYCKSNYLFLEEGDNIPGRVENFKSRFNYNPKIIAVRGKGFIAVEDTEKSAQISMDVFEDMMKVSYLSENFGGPRPMTQSQIDFIDNWEVENYRRQISKSN